MSLDNSSISFFDLPGSYMPHSAKPHKLKITGNHPCQLLNLK